MLFLPGEVILEKEFGENLSMASQEVFIIVRILERVMM